MQPGIKNDLTYLLRIIESVHKIGSYTAGYTEVLDFYFANDQKDFNASLMLFIHIGEQTARIDEGLKQRFPDLPWRLMKDFRNRVVHDYAGLDTYKVFAIIKNDLPALVPLLVILIRELLGNGTFDREELLVASASKYYGHINFDEILAIG